MRIKEKPLYEKRFLKEHSGIYEGRKITAMLHSLCKDLKRKELCFLIPACS